MKIETPHLLTEGATMTRSIQAVLDTLAVEDGAIRYNKDDSYKTKHKMITSSEWPLFRQAFPVVADAIKAMSSE